MAPQPKQLRDADGKVVRVGGKSSNGSGSVYHVPSVDRWRAAWVDPATGKRVTRNARTKQEAQRKLAELKETADSLKNGAPLGTAAEAWLDRRATRPLAGETELRPGTVIDYEKRVARLGRSSIGEIPVGVITLSDLQRWQQEALSDYAVKTVRGDVVVLTEVLSAAIAGGYREHNPARELRFAKQTKAKKRSLTPDEVRKLLAAAEVQPLGAIVHLLFTTGMRISEALGLSWDDIDFDNSTAHVRRAWHGGSRGFGPPKNSGALGLYRLSPKTLAALSRLQSDTAARRSEDWPAFSYEGEQVSPVFLNGEGSVLIRQQCSKMIKKIMRDAGLHDPDSVATHTARRTVVTLLDDADVPLQRISDLVGHADTSTTAGYSQREARRDAATAQVVFDIVDSSQITPET